MRGVDRIVFFVRRRHPAFSFSRSQTAKNDFSQLNFENKIPYQFNVHRFEDQPGNHKTKSHRNSQNHFWIEDGLLNDSVFRLSITGKKFNFRPLPKFSNCLSFPSPAKAALRPCAFRTLQILDFEVFGFLNKPWNS